jgi:nucleotide-binding universal stress UspA family protein
MAGWQGGRSLRSMATQNASDRAPGTTLIAGYDGSESAAAAVRWAAARTADGGRLIVVCADHPAVPRPAVAARTARAKAGLEAHAAQRSNALLNEIPDAAIAGLEQVRVEVLSLDGPPVEALLHAARDHGADGIAVGTRGIGSSSADTGSVSSELLRSADRPVLVIPPAALAHPQES